MKTRRRRKAKGREGIPFVAALGTMGGFLLAYLIAEATLNPRLHPLHWIVAGAGAVVGAGLGYLWFRLRGDIG